MKQYIILCPNNEIYRIEAKSEKQIKDVLDPILQKIIDDGYFEKGDITNYIHEYNFHVGKKECHARDFIQFNWYQNKVWFEYKITTLDEWFFRGKIKLFESNE